VREPDCIRSHSSSKQQGCAYEHHQPERAGEKFLRASEVIGWTKVLKQREVVRAN
jgi:hypothetical protein